MSKDTILITGGASGIGRALAERLLRDGHDVIVCGRREEKLREAREALTGLRTIVADVASSEGRVALFNQATREFPDLNVLINNAGVMRFTSFEESPEFAGIAEEIATNLEAPIHLASLFIPHLRGQDEATIVFVSSGLAFVPLAASPVYSATKAGIHSFALALRHQLQDTSIGVVEIIPPHVNTDLGAPGTNGDGMPLDEFADIAVEGLRRRDYEIATGFSAEGSQASRAELDTMFAGLNAPRTFGA